MKITKLAMLVSIGAALSACGTAEIVTRDAAFAAPKTVTFAQTATGDETEAPSTVRTISTRSQPSQTILPEAILRQINITKINVHVPQTLSVSEANRYYPTADIVWRGDPMGNRHAQISKIVHDALVAGTSGFQGPTGVLLDVELKRFHSVTEKARYTVGGVHNIVFRMILRDATTGETLSQSKRVSMSLEAFGGQQAIAAESRGLTQKIRITTHLAELIRQQLIEPEMYEDASAAFMARIGAL
ncbi:MAG: DUF6778 family protein [Sulfitobacter sp.]